MRNKTLFAFTVSLLFCRSAFSQNTLNYSKGGTGLPLHSFSFDKPDSIVVIVPKGKLVNWVSYKKLKDKMNFAELNIQEKNRDHKIRNRYPYNINQFDSNGHLIPASDTNRGSSHFDQIPKKNITQKNDTTFIVYFKYHPGYSYKEAVKKMTYYSRKGHKRIRRDYVEKQADYLKPSSKYQVIIGTSVDLSIFNSIDAECQTPNSKFPSSLQLWTVIDSLEAKSMMGLHFVPSFNEYKNFYLSDLKQIYDSIRTFTSGIPTNNSKVAKTTSWFVRSVGIQYLVKSLQSQQENNFANTGISRDSLTLLYTVLGNINSGDTNYFKEVTNGDITLTYPVIGSSSDHTANIQTTETILNKLINYINFLNSTPAINYDSAADSAIIKFKKDLLAWIDALNCNIKSYAYIILYRQLLSDKVQKNENFSYVSFDYANTYSQDIITRGKLTIAPDFGAAGFGYMGGKENDHFKSITPYLGIQVNFRPFDQSVSLKSLPWTRRRPWSLVRFSAMMGVTLISLKENGKRDNFFSGSNLLLGFGYRLTTEVRLVAGALLFKKYDSNYESSAKQLAATEYAGISIDINLKDLFSNVFGPFSGK